MMILPDQLHTLWQLTDHDANYAMRWSLIKRSFSKSLPKISVSQCNGQVLIRAIVEI